MSYVTVIGAGSWGTTLARLLGNKEYDVALWAYDDGLAAEINELRTNPTYLPGVKLPDSIKAYSDIGEALDKARFVVSVVPTQHTRSVMVEALPHIPRNAEIVSASKGIEIDTHLTVSQIIKELSGRPISALSGPSFSKEVSQGLPTAVTLASWDSGAALHFQELFNTDYFRVYTHDDVIGAELGGALKNVMAIASGISDGLGMGNAARAALITRGLHEMRKLGVAMGARPETFAGLSGVGDLVLTCTANLSRNYSFGQRLASGEKASKILAESKSVVEGAYTAKAAYDLSTGRGVEMPIVAQIHGVVYSDRDPRSAVGELMGRSLKHEFNE